MLEFISFILALGLGVFAVWLYINQGKWKASVLKDLKEDEITIRDNLQTRLDSFKEDISKNKDKLNAQTFGLLKLTKVLVDTNNSLKQHALSNRYLEGKDVFKSALSTLVYKLSDSFIQIQNISVTASGIKVIIPTGQYYLSFSKKTVKLTGESLAPIDTKELTNALKK